MLSSWTNLTVYHVNPLHLGVLPINMNTADLSGDAFFDLRSAVLPIQCAGGNASGGYECRNGEEVDADLVITRLALSVRDSSFGEYSRCNICGDDGVDIFSGLPCRPKTYICSCGEWWGMRDCTNETTVGREDIGRAFGRWGSCRWSEWIHAPWKCWPWPVVHKTGGLWYSTTEKGHCDAPGADTNACTWRATVEKVVNKSCSSGLIHAAVEAHDREAGGGCFDGCPSRRLHPLRPAPRGV